MIGRKQPGEKIAFGFDFTAELGAATIESVDAVVITPGGELTAGTPAEASGVVTILFEGGVDGTAYSVEVTVTASDDQVYMLPGTIEVAEQPAAADAAADTPAGLKALFPAFASVPNATIQVWLTRAARTVDASWIDADRAYGRALLAAHLMVGQGLGTGAEAEMAANGASGFKSMKSGALSLERFDNAGGAAAGAYGGTAYGREFAVLLRQNHGGPRITGTGALPRGCWPWG